MGTEGPNAQRVFIAPLGGSKHRRTFEGRVDSALCTMGGAK